MDKLPDLTAAPSPTRGGERGCPTGWPRQGGKGDAGTSPGRVPGRAHPEQLTVTATATTIITCYRKPINLCLKDKCSGQEFMQATDRGSQADAFQAGHAGRGHRPLLKCRRACWVSPELVPCRVLFSCFDNLAFIFKIPSCTEIHLIY